MAKIKKGDIIICYEKQHINIYGYTGGNKGTKILYCFNSGCFKSVDIDYFKNIEIVKILHKEEFENLLKNQKENFVKLQHPDGKDFPELNVCPVCGESNVVYTIWKLKYPYINEMHYQILCCNCDLRLDKGIAVSPKELSEIWNKYSEKRWENEI